MHATTTSASLLAQLRQPYQPPAAWERFVSLYTPLLLTWSRRQGFQEADASDLAQDVLIKLVRLLPAYARGEGQSFRGWLFHVCRNQCRDFRRRKNTRPLPGAEGLSGVDIGSPVAELEEAEYRRELVHRCQELIRPDFNDATWAAFTGVAVEGRSAAEVAAELKLSANAVYMARHRVLARLREELEGLLD
ncbi:MAG: polymerase sigma factor [Gemmataceae bacterium]|nr:polymerase sigma factor [Gemmataceae bacterium]